MNFRFLLPLLAGAMLLPSCRSVPKTADAKPSVDQSPGSAAGGLVSAEDVAAVNLFYKNGGKRGFHPSQAPALTPEDTYFVVDLDGQRAYLYHRKKLIAVSSISSGVRYYRTETGDYTLGQKDLNHRSSSYGNFVNSKGGTVMSDVQNGFDPTPVGARFEGALMKYFMRFHYKGQSTAMGFHRGVLPGHPASHGCVRLPDSMAAWFYQNVPMHTPILVRGTKYGIPIGKSQGRPKRSPKVHSSLKSKPAEAPTVPPAPESDVKTAEPATAPAAEPEAVTTPAPAPAAEPEPAAAPASE